MTVTHNDKQISNLNELEWINGEIWANIYYSRYVIKINPRTAEVTAWVDFSGLDNNENVNWYEGYVLNGIAFYDQKLYVTGKCWSNIYQVELVFNKNITEAPRYFS